MADMLGFSEVYLKHNRHGYEFVFTLQFGELTTALKRSDEIVTDPSGECD